MCIFNGIGTRIAESYYYARNSYWTTGSNLPDDNPRINGLVSFANALVTYQNIVPISLYISIEFVRTVQAYFIWADDDLEFNGRRTLARSWNLSDDLGQIQYIFSDKTGTLTQNLMQFRKCTVGGTVYQGSNEMGAIGEQDGRSRGSDQEAEYMDVLLSNIQGETISSGKQNPQLEPFTDIKLLEDLLEVETEQSLLLRKFFTCLGLCHTVLANEDVNGSIQYKAQSPDEAALVQAAADVGFVFRGRDKNLVRLQLPPGLRASQLPEIAVDEQVQSLLHQPTILPENCKSWGIVEEYELLEVNQFTSMRKRMSVVVQKLEDQRPIPGELYLFVKGADNVIFERLAPGQEAIREQVDGQLESFAAEGLRTLCLAYRKLDRSQLEAWSFKYNQALSQLGEGREDLIESVQDELEHDLVFLGATAIEDKLQDGVPEAISDLKRAGIKVWVATGDKLETAVGEPSSPSLSSELEHCPKPHTYTLVN
jgi:phospholipid-translocating ATPase